jgi:betaine-homocysteine S-methyltransferase
MSTVTKPKNRSLQERLADGSVLCAEGYVFEMERRGYCQAGAFVPEVVLDAPDVVKELHREFLHAGSDVILALTYYAHRDKMRTVGREHDLEAINRQAVRLARSVAREGDALVAGNICNTWCYDPRRKKKTSQIVRSMFEEQVGWAKEEGVDFILAETLSFFGEAEIALDVIHQFDLPAVISFTMSGDKTVDGYEFDEACLSLEDEGAEVVGVNCGRGPKTTIPILRKVRRAVGGHVTCAPVPYRTTRAQPTFQHLKERGKGRAFPTELDPFLNTRSEMAEFAVKAFKLGTRFIGICCGAGPHHVRAMAEALGREVPAGRYSPDLSKHALLGSDKVVKGHNVKFSKLRAWEK